MHCVSTEWYRIGLLVPSTIRGCPRNASIHLHEIDPEQPRLKLPRKKYFKHYVGIKGCEEKLRQSLNSFTFTTISEALAHVPHWPEYEFIDGDIKPRRAAPKAVTPAAA